MVFNKNEPKEYSKRINAVVNFILKNANDELTLSKLAGIANYSPFHFQKIFKQVTGESPKQLIIRVRLENAAHTLIVHRHKPVSEIALDSGFASPATFARAFKNYFGISSEQLRKLPPKKHIALRQSINLKRNVRPDTNEYDAAYWQKNLKVTVTKIPLLHLIFLNSPLSDTAKIQDNFKKIIQLAEAHDLLTADTKIIGIINPHAGLYQTAISCSPQLTLSKELNITEIEGGKFAECKIKGGTGTIFHAFHAFYDGWLPQSAYRIKGHFAFEILSQSPLKKSYNNIARELYIPVEPDL
jgi:AraC family transcriptional regulator